MVLARRQVALPEEQEEQDQEGLGGEREGGNPLFKIVEHHLLISQDVLHEALEGASPHPPYFLAHGEARSPGKEGRHIRSTDARAQKKLKRPLSPDPRDDQDQWGLGTEDESPARRLRSADQGADVHSSIFGGNVQGWTVQASRAGGSGQKKVSQRLPSLSPSHSEGSGEEAETPIKPAKGTKPRKGHGTPSGSGRRGGEGKAQRSPAASHARGGGASQQQEESPSPPIQPLEAQRGVAQVPPPRLKIHFLRLSPSHGQVALWLLRAWKAYAILGNADSEGDSRAVLLVAGFLNCDMLCVCTNR